MKKWENYLKMIQNKKISKRNKGFTKVPPKINPHNLDRDKIRNSEQF